LLEELAKIVTILNNSWQANGYFAVTNFTVGKLFQNYVLTHQHIMEIVLLAT
jgi:hypothetical protein